MIETDLLSELLSDLRLESSVYGRFEVSAPWAVAYPGGEVTAFHMVLEGSCLLVLEGSDAPVMLGAGDFVVVPHGRAHTLCSPAGGVPARVENLIQGTQSQIHSVQYGGGGERVTYLCGAFRFGAQRDHPALSALPPILHVRAKRGAQLPWLGAHLEAVACEARSGRPGAGMLITRLSDVLFVQAIRGYLSELPEDASGWLGAVRDPQIAHALALIHRHPERAWTVASLARGVAMSRSSLAARFTARVGEPPLGYLTRWRMYTARRWLQEGSMRIGRIARQLGYGSEAAFSTAFKRHHGVAPGTFRRHGASKPDPDTPAASTPLTGNSANDSTPSP